MRRGPRITLTGRLVREFLAMGLTNQEIADRLIRNFLGTRVNRTRLIQFIANRRYRHRHARHVEESVDE